MSEVVDALDLLGLSWQAECMPSPGCLLHLDRVSSGRQNWKGGGMLGAHWSRTSWIVLRMAASETAVATAGVMMVGVDEQQARTEQEKG
jgi:hypothetical protein